MNKYAFAIITAVALSASPVNATASTDPAKNASTGSVYLKLSGGLCMLNNSDAEATDTASSITTKWNDAFKYKNGYVFEGAVGDSTGKLRGEIAIGYQSDDVTELFGSDIETLESTVKETLQQWGLSDSYDDLSIKSSAITVMYNLFADYKMKGPVSPYLMGGLGVAFTDMKFSFSYNGVKFDNSYDKTSFAWQVGAGLGLKVTDKVSFDLGYRYFKTMNVDLGSDVRLTFGGSKIMAGMQYLL
jgi:opacity protein-like surface antigen